MKHKKLALLALIAALGTGCGPNDSSSSDVTMSTEAAESSSELSEETTSDEESVQSISSTQSEAISSKESVQSSTTSQPQKVTVPAHTLKDSNPPINTRSKGQTITESQWNSFKYASDSAFAGNYNYTYRANSGGMETIEAFTKDGYYFESFGGKLYYERKSGSTFYTYISQRDGFLREETSLDIQSKYTSRITSEIYVHMFEYSDYEYDNKDGCYKYEYYGTFSSTVKFQGGYLTYLRYTIGMIYFEISATFETTITIPESYYIQ